MTDAMEPPVRHNSGFSSSRPLQDRVVEPEWLDSMAPSESAAQRSRADLRRLNALMGHAGIVRRRCASFAAPSWTRELIDLGSGDGTWLFHVIRAWPKPVEPRRIHLIDRQCLPDEATRRRLAQSGWQVECITADALHWLQSDPIRHQTLVVANLFLHHFPPSELRTLLAAVARQARLFIAAEPRRSYLALWAARALGALGCHRVTRHDAVVSVRAGFRDGEISAAWPEGPEWQTFESKAGLFSHSFCAWRKDA